MELLVADVVSGGSVLNAGLVALAVVLATIIRELVASYVVTHRNGKNGKNGKKRGNPGNPSGNYQYITKDEVAARVKTREQIGAVASETREQTKLLRELCAHSKRHETHLEEARRALERVERRQEEAAKR